MADYGIRISNPGVDVFTGADSEMSLDSKSSIPKATDWEEVDGDVDGNPFTVSHSAGVIPFVVAYATADGSNKVLGNYFNIYDSNNTQIIVSASTTSIKGQIISPGSNEKAYLYSIFPEI